MCITGEKKKKKRGVRQNRAGTNLFWDVGYMYTEGRDTRISLMVPRHGPRCGGTGLRYISLSLATPRTYACSLPGKLRGSTFSTIGLRFYSTQGLFHSVMCARNKSTTSSGNIFRMKTPPDKRNLHRPHATTLAWPPNTLLRSQQHH